MAERRRGLREGVNRIVSGENFGGAVAWGDQISESCGPGAGPPARGPRITDTPPQVVVTTDGGELRYVEHVAAALIVLETEMSRLKI